MSIVVAPRGAMSGRNRISSSTIRPAEDDSMNSTMPAVVSMVSGVLLNEKMPFFAQPMFLNRLLVERPNMRSGRT